MFILETININKKQNLFFDDTSICTKEEITSFFNSVQNKHINSGKFFKDKFKSVTKKSYYDEKGFYVRKSYVFLFKELQFARDYYQDLIISDSPYRIKRRAWHQENNITSEANILDQNFNLIENINNCHNHKCFRFGECPSHRNLDACAVIPEKQDITFFIPIKVV